MAGGVCGPSPLLSADPGMAGPQPSTRIGAGRAAGGVKLCLPEPLQIWNVKCLLTWVPGQEQGEGRSACGVFHTFFCIIFQPLAHLCCLNLHG